MTETKLLIREQKCFSIWLSNIYQKPDLMAKQSQSVKDRGRTSLDGTSWGPAICSTLHPKGPQQLASKSGADWAPEAQWTAKASILQALTRILRTAGRDHSLTSRQQMQTLHPLVQCARGQARHHRTKKECAGLGGAEGKVGRSVVRPPQCVQLAIMLLRAS